MKNVAIFGSSRAGKSTFAKMISKKYPQYHIIVGDDIQWSFDKVFPKMGINSKGGSGMKSDFPLFLSTLFYKSIGRNDGEFNYVVETCDITPDKAIELFNKGNTIVVFIGISKQTAELNFKEIRKYETEKDWTYGISDEEILKHCEYWVGKSIEYEKRCKELGIWYIDTSFNRVDVLKRELSRLESML